jgi:hypothetical protein
LRALGEHCDNEDLETVEKINPKINSQRIQQQSAAHIPDTLSFLTPPSTHISDTQSRSGPDDL